MWINTHSTIYFGSHYLKALPCFLWMSFIISSPWVDSAQMEPNRRNWEGCIREGGGKRGERERAPELFKSSWFVHVFAGSRILQFFPVGKSNFLERILCSENDWIFLLMIFLRLASTKFWGSSKPTTAQARGLFLWTYPIKVWASFLYLKGPLIVRSNIDSSLLVHRIQTPL